MFSFLKKLVSSIVPWSSDVQEDLIKIEEQKVVDFIEYFQGTIEDDAETDGEYFKSAAEQEYTFEQSNEIDVESLNCVHKNGKVTHLTREYGVIDDVIYFEHNQVVKGLILKVNDEVGYSAYKVRENETDRVYKIYAVKRDPENFENEIEDYSSPNDGDDQLHAILRVITDRVIKRKGRKVYFEAAKCWCDLDKIQTNFIPVEGDWVEVGALVSINSEIPNLTGDVLDVKSLKPLLTKSGSGRVTFWSSIKKDGAIENLIYFTRISCEDSYVPSLGDEVCYSAIESDQDRFSWRALKVFMNKTDHLSKRDDTSLSFLANISLFSNQNGISVDPPISSVEVALNQTKTVAFKLTNSGTVKRLLQNTKFHSKKNSQMVLLSPLDCNVFIHPNQSVLYQVQCKGKHLGLTKEVFYLYFQDFTIAKQFEINVVGNSEMNKLLECKIGTVFEVFEDNLKVVHAKPDMVLYGPKPWKPSKFISKEKRCMFKIPPILWNISMDNRDHVEFYKALNSYAPYLSSGLTFKDYADRFHTLLYLEEIRLRLNFRKYNMQEVFLSRSDNFFALKVPGLYEKRPSLIVGDKVVVSQPWSKDGKVQYVGYIYDIKAKLVYVKFHNSFHKTYDDSECCVSFEPNTNFFSRCHEAVNRAVKTHGEHWLFPTAVNEKPPLFSVDLEKETVLEEYDSHPLKSQTKIEQRKRLVWFNKHLNDRQKLAIMGVLEGKGRPLPYIIFGPPGTGKTVTLVETVIQIYQLMPDSRILIATPSNSAGDLICERLIDSTLFKPGQLIRLIALYRAFEGLVPPKLVPYTTYLNFRGVGEKSSFQGTPFNEIAGKQRIIVSTCVSVGMLHFLGFPPGHFTHIFVDEAGQTSEPEVLIATSFQNSPNSQVVLAGDPQQLGPVICCSTARRFGFGMSLLQRLISSFPYTRDVDGFAKTSGFDPRFITKLNFNYRSVPEILSLPSQMFYNSDLISTVSQTEGEEAELIKKFNFEVENRETPPAIIFHGVIGQNYQEIDNPSWFNPHEIWQTVFYIRKLYNIGVGCDDIGVVSPYSKQVQKLKKLLLSLDMAPPKIGSVEEFQGQERQVIIVTTVRSTPRFLRSDVMHSLGFVASPQRLNVALTRARALLIIIGNPNLLSKDPYWINVVKYCLKNKSYIGCNLDDALNGLNKEYERALDTSVKESF